MKKLVDETSIDNYDLKYYVITKDSKCFLQVIKTQKESETVFLKMNIENAIQLAHKFCKNTVFPSTLKETYADQMI